MKHPSSSSTEKRHNDWKSFNNYLKVTELLNIEKLSAVDTHLFESRISNKINSWAESERQKTEWSGGRNIMMNDVK